MISNEQIIKLIEANGYVVHLSTLYNNLESEVENYGSYESYKGAIRAKIESYCSECDSYNPENQNLYAALNKGKGIYTVRKYKFLSTMVEHITDEVNKDKHEAVSICRDVIKLINI